MGKIDVNVIELLEYLQDVVDSAAKVPMTGKVMVDRKEIIEVIDQIVNYLPDEFKKAQWVLNEKERILGDAKKEYENVRKETTEIMKKQVENHDVVKEAKFIAQEIVTSAQRDAKSIRLGAREYADEILCQLEKEVDLKNNELMNVIKANVETFALGLSEDLNKTVSTVRENIKELRNMK